MPRFLLIDDDPIFGSILLSMARKAGVDLTFWQSLTGKSHESLAGFDLLILDYELKNITGLQLLTNLGGLVPPTLLVSAYRLDRLRLARRVDWILWKNHGPGEILRFALQIHAEISDK